MKYPTLEQVKHASPEQLGRWFRFLPSPGASAIGAKNHDEFERVMEEETIILNAIIERFPGWNPALSKTVSWDEPL